ncbi:hypothetical protein NHH73_15110 [Oxalobacteraceae bacterium OTU3CINTB1]|nr:hypothetical protein NHH73_15110 [Oxalobacteraceae bacterium OTU3CINTB1]
MFGKDEAKEKFDDFLLIMDDQLEAVDSEAGKRDIPLAVDMECLENLEKLFFQVTENCSEDEKQGWIVTFSRYVGEIVRETFNGKWNLSLEDPKNIYFNTPVIINHTRIENLQFSPIFAMRALSLRKKMGLLRKIIMADIKPRQLNIDHLEEK